MNVSNDSGHFFQTSASITDAARKEAKRKNDAGSPIRLDSKLLAVIADPDRDGHVYVAEAAGNVRRVNVEDGIIVQTFSGPTAPLSSLILSFLNPTTNSRTLFAGCWDRTIWSWDTSTAKPSMRFTGHSDFVKALAYLKLQDAEFLISGSQDRTIKIWDVGTGKQKFELRGHTRGVLSLAVDPATLPGAQDSSKGEEQRVTLFSADSLGALFAWQISSTSAVIHPTIPSSQPHETSINHLHFPLPDPSDPDADPPDLYTASSDRFAKCLERPKSGAWTSSKSTILPQHPDYIRSIYVDLKHSILVTACRDEEVRIYELGTAYGDASLPVHTYTGHYEEVTGLAGPVVKGGKAGVVSVSIDGTVRWWGFERGEIQRVKEEEEERRRKEDGGEVEEGEKKGGMLTEEEERELAELMEDDD